MSGSTMQAITYRHYGSPDLLRLADVPIPEPKPGEVLVRIHAASLNALDWHLLRGKPYIARLSEGWRRPKRSIPGVDLAGTVEAVGDGVTELSPGDEVFANKGRACAEFVAGRASFFAPKPSNLSMEEAAAVPAAALTALQALRDVGRIQAGQRVLINGASGGVGTFAVQLACAFGGRVTGVTSSHNVEMVRSLGAEEVVDYTRDDFTRLGRRFDLLVDVAGSRPVLAMSRVLEPEGTLVLVGASKGAWIGPMVRILGAGQLSRFTGQRIAGMLTEPTYEDLLTLKELVEAGRIRPIVERVYPLAETADAMHYLETLHARAKLVIQVAPSSGVA